MRLDTPTPTLHVGPFVMSAEFPTPSADEPTYRVPYEEVATIDEAIAWIRRPPFPPETLKKLKKGVLLTARVRAEWVKENGQHGEEIAAMGLVLRVGTKNVPTKIALVTRDGITVDSESVIAEVLGLSTKTTGDVSTWLDWESSSKLLLGACAGVSQQLLTLTACSIARSVLDLCPVGDDRPRVAIETAEAWARGRATLGQVEMTGHAAYAACTGANETASRAARSTAYAALTSTYGHTYAASAAYAATYASGDATKIAHVARRWITLPDVVFAAVTRLR